MLGSWVALNHLSHTGKRAIVMPFSPLTLIFLFMHNSALAVQKSLRELFKA